MRGALFAILVGLVVVSGCAKGSEASSSSGGSGGSGGADAASDAGGAGTAGTDGSAGASGTAGTSGADGGAGASGSAGASGKDGGAGASGSAGASGTDGGAGASGSAGASGKDGGAGASGSAGAGGNDAGSGVPPLLVSDDDTGKIYALDTSGAVLATYNSPVAGPRGVAHDRTSLDGFWVVGTGDLFHFYKVEWSGALQYTIVVNTSFVDPRGLDYLLDAAHGDRLVLIGRNSSPADVVWAYDLSGVRQLESAFYTNGSAQAGVWGVAAVAAGSGLIDRWTTWGDASLQHWDSGGNLVQTLFPNVVHARGVNITSSGDFWMVANDTKIVHLDATGATLGSFAAPGTKPEGLSYQP